MPSVGGLGGPSGSGLGGPSGSGLGGPSGSGLGGPSGSGLGGLGGGREEAVRQVARALTVVYYYARSLAAPNAFLPATHNLTALLRSKLSASSYLLPSQLTSLGITHLPSTSPFLNGPDFA